MKLVYYFTRFQEHIELNRMGNTVRARKLISDLDTLCEDNGGHQLESTPYLSTFQRQEVEEISTYLVGTIWVHNDVNLAVGTRTTDVGHLPSQENKKLMEALTKLYGENNIFRSIAEHEVKD